MDLISNLEKNSTSADGKEIDTRGSVFRTLWICMVSLGGLVVLLVPAVLIRIKSKKQKGPENYDIIALQEIHQNPHDLEGIDSVLQEEERVYSNIASYRIPIDTFIQLVGRKKICNQFSDEFQSLSKDACDFNATTSLREDNYTRLHLDYKDSSNKLDLFNASFIDGLNKRKAYIAAQGPSSSSSINDFWEMIWQNNCTRVVNLTSDSCSEKNTSVRYWQNMDNHIGQFFIKIERLDVYKHYIIRQMLVKKVSDENSKDMRIKHFHFTSWHHQALPECTDSLLSLRELVKGSTAESDGPILVHCSTGTSQTGIFIALDYLLEESIFRGDIDIITCISKLRKQRPSAVQTCDEYIFLHDAVVQYYSKRRQDSSS